jgi:arylsulfatase A-like enzyme
MEYDSTKVAAVLNEIDGYDHSRAHHVGTPAVFGMNFQTVSTAQKLPSSDSLTGGYLPSGQPGPLLTRALQYVDDRVGTMLDELRHQGLAGSTTVILSAKHGQSPVDPTQLRRVDDGAIIDNLNAAWKSAHPSAPQPLVSFAVDDDGMLMWLSDRSAAAQDFAKRYLMNTSAPANRAGDPKGTFSATVPSSGLTSVSTGAAADAAFGAATGDSHAPDLVGITQQGVVYTGNVKKIAEHGGEHPEDLNVPLVVSGAGAEHAVNGSSVRTTQIAPTILRLLGLDPSALQAVRIEGTRVLPGVAD